MGQKPGNRFENFERRVGVVAIVLVLTLLLFVAADNLAARLIPGMRQAKDLYFPKEVFFEPQPYTMFGGTRDPELQKSANLNELGFRGPAPDSRKPPGEYRVIVLGGSTVVFGSPPIPETVGALFEGSGRKSVKVYNFGVPASILRMDTARLVFMAWQYRPDLVVFYGGGNDIGMPFQADPRPGYPPNFLAYENNPLLTAGTDRQDFFTLAKLFLYKSKVFRSTAGEAVKESLVPLEQAREDAGWNTEPWSRRIAAAYLSDIERANQIAAGFGARALFVFQPLLYFKPNLSEREKQANLPELARHATLCRGIINSGLAELHGTRGVDYLDLSGIFEESAEDIFFDGIHVRQKYSDQIAQRIFERIEAYPG